MYFPQGSTNNIGGPGRKTKRSQGFEWQSFRNYNKAPTENEMLNTHEYKFNLDLNLRYAKSGNIGWYKDANGYVVSALPLSPN
jgi:hypothetical protein